MIIFKNTESLNNSQVFRPRPSTLRPQSQQQRPTSLNHCTPNYQQILHKSPTQRQSHQNMAQNEYYTQIKGTVKQKIKMVANSAKIINSIQGYGMQGLQQVKNSLLLTLQKCTSKFKEEIAMQSKQISRLQQKLKNQNLQIEYKNKIISDLTNKQQKNNICDVKKESMQMKKIQDLQIKLNMVVQQIEEQKAIVHKKLQEITNGIIKYFVNKLRDSRIVLSTFILNKCIKLQEINKTVDLLTNKTHYKVKIMQKQLENIQNSIKSYEEMSVKQVCNVSKETASQSSSTLSNNKPNQNDLFLSDYFFHPPQTENPSFKMIEDLARQREKINQLPIRVYLDTFGRLKYYESRTFIFDRKGNFSTPTEKDLDLLEQKGWIKVVAQ